MFLEIAGSYYVMYCLVPFLVSTEEVNILNEFLSFSVKAWQKSEYSTKTHEYHEDFGENQSV